MRSSVQGEHFSIFLHEIFRINVEHKFRTKLAIGIFLMLKKYLAAKFWNSTWNFRIWPPNLNLVLRWFWKFHEKISRNVKALAFWANTFYAKTQIEICHFCFLDIQNKYWVKNCREHVNWWYKSNGVGFIQKYSFLAKLLPKNGEKMAHMPIFKDTFFGNNSAIFEPVGLKFL